MPITAITYGNIKFESQKAKIRIGPLTCYPPEQQYNVKKHLELLEQRTNDTIEKTEEHETKLGNLEDRIVDQDTKINELKEDIAAQSEKIANHGSQIENLEALSKLSSFS